MPNWARALTAAEVDDPVSSSFLVLCCLLSQYEVLGLLVLLPLLLSPVIRQCHILIYDTSLCKTISECNIQESHNAMLQGLLITQASRAHDSHSMRQG